MSTSVLKAFPGKLDIKRHSPVFSFSCDEAHIILNKDIFLGTSFVFMPFPPSIRLMAMMNMEITVISANQMPLKPEVPHCNGVHSCFVSTINGFTSL